MSDTTNEPPPQAAKPRQKAHGTSGHASYADLAKADDFRQLRRKYRSFAIPWTIAFLAWYLLYVVMSNWATGFMEIRLVGNINVALVFGILQFVSTFGIAFLYARYSNRELDPLARKLNDRYNEEIAK